MPDEENTAEQEQQQQADPLAGTKYAGKTAAEIAAMHEALEQKLGEQGDELGRTRREVDEIKRSLSARQPADKNEYTELGDRLIVNPGEALPELEERIERRVLGKVNRARTNDQVVAQFFAANPDLEQYKDIVSVIGEKIFQANPDKSLSEILALTKRESTAYISDLKKRMGVKDPVSERKRAGVTTSGGSARESVRTEDEPEESETDPEQAAVLKAVQEVKNFRVKKIAPPRSR